jgi:hypothetical protein
VVLILRQKEPHPPVRDTTTEKAKERSGTKARQQVKLKVAKFKVLTSKQASASEQQRNNKGCKARQSKAKHGNARQSTATHGKAKRRKQF